MITYLEVFLQCACLLTSFVIFLHDSLRLFASLLSCVLICKRSSNVLPCFLLFYLHIFLQIFLLGLLLSYFNGLRHCTSLPSYFLCCKHYSNSPPCVMLSYLHTFLQLDCLLPPLLDQPFLQIASLLSVLFLVSCSPLEFFMHSIYMPVSFSLLLVIFLANY